MTGFDFIVRDEDGVTWTPWTDGHAIGYRADHEDGRRVYVLLNPSLASTDGTPTVFLYETDDAAVDYGDAITYLAPFGITEHQES